MSVRRVVGCMTGTSIDALDAALVEVEGVGLAMRARVVRSVTEDLGVLAEPLRRLASQSPMTAGEIARLSLAFAELHVGVIRGLLRDAHSDQSAEERAGEREGERVDLIAVHGQTVFHEPPASWQLMTPGPIARAFGCPVAFDLRGADLAAGGQGAPITPMADYVFFRHATERRAIVNLGGFCNYTVLPACGEDIESPAAEGGVVRRGTHPTGDATSDVATTGRSAFEAESELSGVRGGDICACNQLLDLIARERLNRPFDEGGAAAMSGTGRSEALAVLRALLKRQARAGRSLGTGDDVSAWVEVQRGLTAADMARTACEAIGATIAGVLAGHAPLHRVIVAGGGARNAALVGAIRSALARAGPTEAPRKSPAPAGTDAGRIETTRTSPTEAGMVDGQCISSAAGLINAVVEASDEHGVPISQRESAAMAVLGALCEDGVPITMVCVTGAGAPAPISGCWTNVHGRP